MWRWKRCQDQLPSCCFNSFLTSCSCTVKGGGSDTRVGQAGRCRRQILTIEVVEVSFERNWPLSLRLYSVFARRIALSTSYLALVQSTVATLESFRLLFRFYFQVSVKPRLIVFEHCHSLLGEYTDPLDYGNVVLYGISNRIVHCLEMVQRSAAVLRVRRGDRRSSGSRGERWSRGRAPDCQSRGRWFNPTYRRFET